MRIQPEAFERNPTVNHFVTVVRDALAARERLSSVGSREAREVIKARAPIAATRLGQASNLYKVEATILEEGFYGREGLRGWHGQPVDIDRLGHHSITRPLDRALEPYGFAVAPQEGWANLNHQVFLQDRPSYTEPEPVAGVWTGAPVTTAGEEPWQIDGDWSSHWYWADMPGERQDPEHHADLAVEARRHGLPADAARDDLVAHTLLSTLVYGRQLVEETRRPEVLPPAPGLSPSAQDRLARVAPLNRLAVAMVEDVFRPGHLTVERFVAELEPVIGPAGLVVRPLAEG